MACTCQLETPHDMDTVQIFNFFCTTSKLKSEGNIQWQSTFNAGDYKLAVKGNDFISRAIPIDRFTLYSNFKNSFYNPPAFISQIIPGVDAIYE